MTDSLIYLAFGLILLAAVASHVRGLKRREAKAQKAAEKAGLRSDGPRAQHPHIDVRHSGALTLVDFEDRYRDWLSRWYPRKVEQGVIVETNDQLIRQRVLWLADSQELCLIPRSTQESQAADDALTFRIDEDDRFFAFHRASGLQINAGRLADSLNRAIASHASHITVHADDVSGRFWLTDAARPSLGLSTEQIHDALAVLGLVCRLASAGRLSCRSCEGVSVFGCV